MPTRDALRIAAPIPARAGIGLRALHYRDVIETRPGVGWLEVHSENYFGDGGAPLYYLERARAQYPVSLHGVGLSLGSADPLNRDHLRKLQRLIARIEPGLVSDHLCWSSVDGRYLNDLLPLPYTEEALDHIVERIVETQEFLGCQILVENPSSYLRYKHSTVPEWEFLAAAAERADCGILLDVNNVYVSARNHGFDPRVYLRAVPADRAREIHLAGHTARHYEDGETADTPNQMAGRTSEASRASESARGPRLGPIGDILIDTHNTRVCDAVWELYRETVARLGPRPTLIEWDSDLPALAVLVEEAAMADRIMERARDTAAA
jgi:uncharacterized protein (UPF0276 family)